MDAETYFAAITKALKFAVRKIPTLMSTEEEAIADMLLAIEEGRVQIVSKAK